MKKNITKIIVSLSSISIAFSVWYYFIFFVPSEKLLTRQIECKRIAQEMYDKSVKQQKLDEDEVNRLGEEWDREFAELSYYTLSTPFYKFSKKMNTCLYKIGISQGLSFHTRSCSVIDVYANSKLISYKINTSFDNRDKISLEDQEKYDNFLLSEKDLTGNGDCIFQSSFDALFKTKLNPKT